MTEILKDVAAERDALRAENENLRGQLSAASATRPGVAAPVQHQFVLNEGQRQELIANGVANVGGRLLTAEQVRAKLGPDQQGVEIPDAKTTIEVPPARDRTAVAGVDFVYPSVAPGEIDPKVAGTPGINGPAASTDRKVK